MSKRLWFGLTVIGLAAVLGGGVLIASNMGFKLNYLLENTGTATGTNTIALPFNRQAGVNDAKQLMDDIGFTSVANVKRWVESDDTLQTYTGRRGSPLTTPFPLTTGEGYYVTMSGDVNYIVAGSHDPAFLVDLDSSGEADSATGTNFYAYPYHSTVSDAKALMDDIGFANVANVKRWVKTDDTLQTYTGRRGSPLTTPFALTPGEAYFVTMSTTVSDYVPSHY